MTQLVSLGNGLYDRCRDKWVLDVKFSPYSRPEENLKLLEKLKPLMEDYINSIENKYNTY